MGRDGICAGVWRLPAPRRAGGGPARPPPDVHGRRGLVRARIVRVRAGELGETLIGARAVQGLGEAIVSPAVLSIITTTFTEGAERNKALGVWGGVGGSGAAAGVLFGGVLTKYLGWEWIFLVNREDAERDRQANDVRTAPPRGRQGADAPVTSQDRVPPPGSREEVPPSRSGGISEPRPGPGPGRGSEIRVRKGPTVRASRQPTSVVTSRARAVDRRGPLDMRRFRSSGAATTNA